MKTIFVDSNVFLRFFTNDSAGHKKKASNLFKKAGRGEVRLVTGPPVLFEIAWTLRSTYKLNREKVLEILSSIESFPGLQLLDGPIVGDAIALAKAEGQEFADAYVAASASGRNADSIATFNVSDFKNLGSALYPL